MTLAPIQMVPLTPHAATGKSQTGREELTKHLSKDQNQDHAHKESGLLGCTTHASITHDSDSEAGGKTGETDGQAGTELDEVGEEGGFLLEVVGNQDADDEAVDGDDTGHDYWDDVYT